jgi:NDP-sugar pyrophosphorylase family protein
MINVLLPMAGDSALFDPQLYPYPLPLTELLGRPMIEHVVANLSTLGDDVRFVFVVKADDCRRFHLDHTLELLAPRRCEIVRLNAPTRGALCSALMAVPFIDHDDPLVISNFDQLIDPGLKALFDALRASGCDAGCLTFDAVHPRWSYARLDGDTVVEAAEKKPISRHAIAAFYYFARGARFVSAAKRTLLNQASVDGRFYIAPVFNQLILDGERVQAVPVPPGSYFSFYTPQRIDDYERLKSKRPDAPKRERAPVPMHAALTAAPRLAVAP